MFSSSSLQRGFRLCSNFTRVFHTSIDSKPNGVYLFVYGTLMRNRPNHTVLQQASGAKFVTEAQTIDPFKLAVGGPRYVPYLMNAQQAKDSQCVVGEVWQVDQAALQKLDEFEGVHRDYYKRVPIQVTTPSSHSKPIPSIRPPNLTEDKHTHTLHKQQQSSLLGSNFYGNASMETQASAASRLQCYVYVLSETSQTMKTLGEELSQAPSLSFYHFDPRYTPRSSSTKTTTSAAK